MIKAVCDKCGKEIVLKFSDKGLESLPDEKKNFPGLFITDETLDSVCLIYKAPDDEIVYRYLDADGNTRSALRDFFEDLAGQLQTEGKRGDA